MSTGARLTYFFDILTTHTAYEIRIWSGGIDDAFSLYLIFLICATNQEKQKITKTE